VTSEEIHAVHLAAYHDRRVSMPAHLTVAFDRAVTLAREAGVSFPPGQVVVWTYQGRDDEPSVAFFKDRPVRVYLNLGLPFRTAAEWIRHILHELAHAFFDARQDIGVLQREMRAEAFAQRAMQRYGGR